MEKETGKGLLLIITFFTLTPVALITSLYALFNMPSKPAEPQVLAASGHNLFESPQSGVSVYASLPSSAPVAETKLEFVDARPIIIKNYLKRYGSPLEPYANYLVEAADRNGLDFRLLVAIAQQESNLCKRIPPDSHNCWGWGIHSEGSLGFSDFETSINAVATGLKEEYRNKGLITVEEIMSKWVPHSPEGSWAKGVGGFMQQME